MLDARPIRLEALRELCTSGAVRGLSLVAQGRAFYLLVRIGMEERLLVARSQRARSWSDLNRAVKFVHDDLKMGECELHLQQFDPSQKRAA